ncbi:hypothetical protein OROGR_010609 [Orobanche gracilis]
MAPQLRPLPHRHRNKFSSTKSIVSSIELKRGRENLEINDSVDRLSDLPDPVLCHILSFMDTKYAVAASVLSTRWKHLNTYVPDIILDDSLTKKEYDGHLGRPDFGLFGLRQIMMKDVPYINKFHLTCDTSFEVLLLKLIVTASVRLNVREVYMFLGKRGDFDILPPSFFTCTSLVDLKLSGIRTSLVVPSLVDLPNLKVLHLHGHYVNSVEEGSVNRLLRGCKLLEDLSISCCEVGILELSFPFLRKFSFEEDVFFECEKPSVVEFVMDTPNLEVFKYWGHHVAKSLCMKTLAAPHARAEINLTCSSDHRYFDDDDHIWKDMWKDTREFINCLCGLRSLHLSSKALKSMYPGGYLPSPYEDPVFKTLIELELGRCNFKKLPSILVCAPLLEVLVMRGRGEQIYPEYSPEESLPLSSSEILPECLAKHLRIVEFKAFAETDEAFELVKYILRNGCVMEMMRFSKERFKTRVKDLSDEARSRILSFPRCSTTCKIVFDEMKKKQGYGF